MWFLWLVFLVLFFAILSYILVQTPQAQQLIRTSPTIAPIPFKTDRNDMPVLDIFIGHPKQRVQVVLDTGSGDLVITGRDCNSCRGRSYNPKKSKTSVKGEECSILTYGTQEDSGCWYTDTVKFGRSNELEREMTFMVTTDRRKSSYNGKHPLSQYSILGLAKTESNSAITNLLTHDTFTIVNDKGNHSLILSSYDDYAPSNKHTFVQLPMAPYQDLYAATVQSCQWGKASVPVNKIVMDSGSNMVFVPSHMWTNEMTQARNSRKDLVIQFPGAIKLKFVVPGRSVKKYVMSYETSDPVVIVGCLILQECILEFNVSTKNVRVAHT